MKNSTSIQIVSSENLKEIVREVLTEEIPKLLPQKSTEGKYYTRKEAAKRARITLPTLDKYIQEGKIKEIPGLDLDEVLLYNEEKWPQNGLLI